MRIFKCTPLRVFISKCYRNILSINGSEAIDLKLSSCLLSNVSICSVTQSSDKFLVAVYNPLSWTVTHHVRLPVNGTNFTVQGPDGNNNHILRKRSFLQSVCCGTGTEIYDVVDAMPYFETSQSQAQSKKELVFAARNVSPLGIKLYYVTKTASTSEEEEDMDEVTADKDLTFGDNVRQGTSIPVVAH